MVKKLADILCMGNYYSKRLSVLEMKSLQLTLHSSPGSSSLEIIQGMVSRRNFSSRNKIEPKVYGGVLRWNEIFNFKFAMTKLHFRSKINYTYIDKNDPWSFRWQQNSTIQLRGPIYKDFFFGFANIVHCVMCVIVPAKLYVSVTAANL